ncbi:restriction endonuclease [Methanoplanus endosymbiosus]|uniref:DEAD/DEAH box helicase family protein n=1 Tax=Methanoplanus endosymbiosus TaxID=33865 RepID=A0A9E7PN86_9EURY|nr:DEAD/DEAH box helicase family protein [Methanoplanus endosymbiosus]UUX92980.1 DEAD/DEAH box helicase family protein [Methanoplanus endosymbiosus]
MSDKVTFRFDDSLDYQLDAINSAVNLFEGQEKTEGTTIYRESIREMGGSLERNPRITLSSSRLLKNLHDVQFSSGLDSYDSPLNGNYTVEMETGTGKTYVYLRTILELYKTYGLRKFIIVVPSIAIKKGVEKSIEQLNEHFKALYDSLDINSRSFVYTSKAIGKLQDSFTSSPELSIAIMNIQAFNKDTNIIRQEIEGRPVLWDLLKDVRPIIIIDEPQKIEGTKKKKSSSLKAIEELNPQFILRYSATHKNLYNQIYKLSSYDAYEKGIVKKIEVKTIYGEVPKDFPYIRYVNFTSDLKAKLEIFCRDPDHGIVKKKFDVQKGNSISELSGGLSQYKDMFVHSDPHKIEGVTISSRFGQQTLFDPDTSSSKWGVTIKNGHADFFTLIPGDCTYNEELKLNDSIVTRVQIRIAIKNHLDKQFAILEEGKEIKALSLFFIDSVKKVRDDDAPDGRGQYLKIFDEEYQNLIQEEKYRSGFKKYAKYFPEYTDVLKVREGYFARDKTGKVVEPEETSRKGDSDASVEDSYKAKSKEDIERGISLILEGKEELISFNTPLAFIFSHSALREGWDNPNIFTICTLKQGNSDISKKQELGRGLRLPVDINGSRCLEENVNWLTVIANAYYENFARDLQADFNAESGFDRETVTLRELRETLVKSGIPGEKITPKLVSEFKSELKDNVIINSKDRLTGDASKISTAVFKDETLKEHSSAIREAFVEVMRTKGSRKILIKNGDQPDIDNDLYSYLDEDSFRKLLRDLTLRMEKRTYYEVDIDSDKFILDAAAHLSGLLKRPEITSQQISITKSRLDMKETGEAKLCEPTARYETEEASHFQQKKSDFQIVNYIMSQTRLPRMAIYAVLGELEPEEKEYLRTQDILDIAATELRNLLQMAKAEKVTGYHVIQGYVFDERTLFESDVIDPDLLEEEKKIYRTNAKRRKALYPYYRTDSDGEYDFARHLEDDDDVLLFTKLHKGGFVIDTPYGNYSPDWAIIYRKGESARLYFVIETKINKDKSDLTAKEVCKIECGKLHFKAVSDDVKSDNIKFLYARNYQDFKEKMI